MRSIKLACACALVAGLAAFHLQTRAGDGATLAVQAIPEAAPVRLPAVPPPPEPIAPPAVPPAASGSETVGRPPERGTPRARPRAERRRRRYRYDVPVPSSADWKPPEGPVRIALQAGHWRADEAPAELSGLRDNGTRGAGKAEWEVNLEIARRAAVLLEQMGYEVDVLPAVVPPSYRAHLFVSIHADGSADPHASGFRVAAPRRDYTGRASRAAALLEQSYAEATGLERLPTVTRRMRNYYAFNFRRYQHALNPMTIGVIIETGFLTSATDREVIVDHPERAARGIVAAVAAFPETPPPRPGESLAAATGSDGGGEAAGSQPEARITDRKPLARE